MLIGKRLWRPLVAAGVVAGAGLVVAPTLVGAAGGFAGSLNKISVVASTVPGNGDVNPYGVAVAPTTTGRLVAGDVLVSNFNDSANLQGTGRPSSRYRRPAGVITFAHLFLGDVPGACPGGIGLTTALVALRSGWVVVGSLPTRDGTSATAKAGCLIVLNPWGTAVETISGRPHQRSVGHDRARPWQLGPPLRQQRPERDGGGEPQRCRWRHRGAHRARLQRRVRADGDLGDGHRRGIPGGDQRGGAGGRSDRSRSGP